MTKIQSGSRPKIAVWRPPDREGGRIEIYVGECLKGGCRFLGPDYDYPNDPAKLTLSMKPSDHGQSIGFRGKSGLVLEMFIPE